MAIPGGNPADAIKQIATEIQEKFDEAGMGKVEEFTDKIDDIIEKVKSGPKAIMEQAKGAFEEFKGAIDGALKDPSSLAPGGGAMTACATMYGNSVVAKLGTLNDEAGSLVSGMGDVAKSMEGPLGSIQETLEKAMAELEATLKGLAKLPKTVQTAIAGKDSPDDIAKIDTAPMKKAIAGGDVDGPLNSIKGLKDVLGDAAGAVEKAIASLADFIERAPGMVRGAFDVPPPLCFLSTVILSQAPKAMTDLLAMIDKLKEVKLQSIIDIFQNTTNTLANLDIDAVKTPMNKFTESAGGLVDKLEKTVQGAKLSANPAGALPAGVGSVI